LSALRRHHAPVDHPRLDRLHSRLRLVRGVLRTRHARRRYCCPVPPYRSWPPPAG